jgi:opacity protein-like surface antigen
MATKLLHWASTPALALGLLAQPASAETPARPWYVGVAGGTTNTEVFNPSVFVWDWEEGPARSSWSLQGGYQASRRFAVELTTLRAANLAWVGPIGPYDSDSRFDVTATEVAAVGLFPAGPVEFHGKLGLSDYDLAGTQTLESTFNGPSSPASTTSRPIAESGQGFLLGMGVGAQLTPLWSVRLDYRSVYIDSRFLGTAEDDYATIDTYSLVVSYRFGRDRDAPARP